MTPDWIELDDGRVRLACADCLEAMPEIEAGSVDMVMADLPYGTTACKWDTVIPFAPLWGYYKRCIKPNGAIVLTASQPFTSALVMSNPALFKHECIWDKVIPAGFQIAKYRPMQRHESVVVFCNGSPPYFPQMTTRDKPRKGTATFSESSPLKYYDGKDRVYTKRYPTSIFVASNADHSNRLHPTQKPVALMEYLIRTYTNADETVLDNTMGSGTTGVACVNTKRRFIGIEKDPGYFKICIDRITAAIAERNSQLAFV